MAKKKPVRRKLRAFERDLFTGTGSRRRRALILPRYLTEDADKFTLRGAKQDKAWEIIKRWADLELEGHLAKKETSLDADFLREVFGEALGYQSSTQSPTQYQLQRNFTVPGVGTADGALGNFSPPTHGSPGAVIELKDSETNLDTDRFNGRTPVQQCWDYLNALPECPWGIVSNFVSFRLYNRHKTPLAYEEFLLQDLRDLDNFRKFYCLFEVGGLLPSAHQQPRARLLLERTENRRREVGDQLYETYSFDNYGVLFEPGEMASFLKERATLSKEENIGISQVCEFIHLRNVSQLEQLATAAWIRTRENIQESESVAQRLHELKPHISLVDARKADQELVSFLQKSSLSTSTLEEV